MRMGFAGLVGTVTPVVATCAGFVGTVTAG